MNGFHENSDLVRLINGTLIELNDTNGDIGDTIRNSAFYDADSIEYVNLPAVKKCMGQAFYDCDKLEYVQLDNCQDIVGGYQFSYCDELKTISLKSLSGLDNSGGHTFRNCPKLETLILGQNQVSFLNDSINNSFQNTANNKNYVPSDLLRLYKEQSNWSSHATRFRSMAQLGKDETEYVLYHIVPYIQQVSGNIYNRAMCRYETSVETVYGRDVYIVGLAEDTLTVQATCQGYVTKNMTISLDSSYTTTVEPDLTDMQVDSNYNGHNLLYADFTKFESNLGTCGYCSRNNTYAWSASDVRHLGCGNFGNGRWNWGITFPDYSGMTNPTFVFEAGVYFTNTDSTGNSGLFHMPRYNNAGGALDIDKISIKHTRSGGGGIDVEGLDLVGHHHVALVANSSTVYVYIDGVLNSTIQNANLFNSFKTTSGYIGKDDNNAHQFQGRIKHIALTLRDIADPSIASNCEFILSIPQGNA